MSAPDGHPVPELPVPELPVPELPVPELPVPELLTSELPTPGHLVPDLLAPGLRLILVGSAPSTISARAQAYYANPQNKFWRTLHAAGLTPEQLAPRDYRQLLTLGIGLTDVCKRHAGADAALPGHAWEPDELRARLAPVLPSLLAFTSKRAAAEALGRATGRLPYGVQHPDTLPEWLSGAEVWVLPSTSPLGHNHFQLGPWLQLGEHFRTLSPG